MSDITLREHFSILLRPLFPQEAIFVAIPADTDEIKFRVHWPMPTPTRPNKHSRPIVLHFVDALLDDYRDSTDSAFRRRVDGRIVEYILARLAAFKPDHDFPAVVPVPEETWIFGTDFEP